MIGKRIASAAVGIPMLLFCLRVSPFFWCMCCCAGSLLLAKEMLDFSSGLTKFHRGSVYVCTVVLYGFKWIFLTKVVFFTNSLLVVLVPISILMLVCGLFEILQKDFANTIERISWPIFCFLYASLFLSFMVDFFFLELSPISSAFHLSTQPSTNGMWYICYVFTGAWMCDTGALFCGKYWGKHTMNISCSPTKTWVGLLGGIGFSLVGMYTIRTIVLIKEPGFTRGGFFDPTYATFFFCVSLSISLLSIAGDLLESVIKRSKGKKDSGNFIPGMEGYLIQSTLVY